MQPMEIIQIPFQEQQVLAFVVENRPYVAVKPICENMGIDWEAQRKRIQRDTVLSEGASMMEVPSNGGPQQTLCLPLEMLNGWLFGIDDTRVKPELQEMVIRYKKECYKVLSDFFFKGYALNERRLSKDVQAQQEVYDTLKKWRLSDATLYRKITDFIRVTSTDYEEAKTKNLIGRFFAQIQNRLHVAVTGKTAADIVYENVDPEQYLVGMISFKGEPGKITTQDVTTAKNFLDDITFRKLENLYEQMLLFAENKVLNGEMMTLSKWENHLMLLIEFNGYDPFKGYLSGVNRKMADDKAKTALKDYKQRVKTIAGKDVKIANLADYEMAISKAAPPVPESEGKGA